MNAKLATWIPRVIFIAVIAGAVAFLVIKKPCHGLGHAGRGQLAGKTRSGLGNLLPNVHAAA